MKWTPAGRDEREEEWAGVGTSNFGYMIMSFVVGAADGVSAHYRAPMFDLNGTPAPGLEVTCTGDSADWSRLSCPSFNTSSGAPDCDP